ncbi:MAG: sulfate adenylyltransferase, partial [Sulfurifustaceae bacterium]
MAELVKPHGGGALKPLLLEGEARGAELARAKSFKHIRISSRETGDLIMLGIGG